jgi:hypothetical protein
MVNQEQRRLDLESVAIHGLCCDSVLKQSPERPPMQAEEAHIDEQRPKYSLPCD